MNTPQNPSEWAVQMGKNVISIIPTIRTFSYIFVPIRNSRFSSDSHFFVLFRTFSCTNGRQSLHRARGLRITKRCPSVVWQGLEGGFWHDAKGLEGGGAGGHHGRDGYRGRGPPQSPPPMTK